MANGPERLRAQFKRFSSPLAAQSLVPTLGCTWREPHRSLSPIAHVPVARHSGHSRHSVALRGPALTSMRFDFGKWHDSVTRWHRWPRCTARPTIIIRLCSKFGTNGTNAREPTHERPLQRRWAVAREESVGKRRVEAASIGSRAP